jgi:hypothetical protein
MKFTTSPEPGNWQNLVKTPKWNKHDNKMIISAWLMFGLIPGGVVGILQTIITGDIFWIPLGIIAGTGLGFGSMLLMILVM